MITDPFPWAFITLGAPSTSPWICFESPQYFVTGLRRLQSHSLNPHHQHNEGDNPLYPPSTSHAMLYLRNFQIWSTAPPQAAVAQQLGMEGSNGRRQHHTPAECVTPQGEQPWCSSFSDERLGLHSSRSTPSTYQNHIHCGFKSCPPAQLCPCSAAQAGEGRLYTGCIPMPRTVTDNHGLKPVR